MDTAVTFCVLLACIAVARMQRGTEIIAVLIAFAVAAGSSWHAFSIARTAAVDLLPLLEARPLAAECAARPKK